MVAVSLKKSRNPDQERRSDSLLLLRFADSVISVVGPIRERARELEQLGFQSYDALHLSCAEAGGCDLLVTTDDRLLRRAQRLALALQIKVLNPLDCVLEVQT